MPSGHLGDRDSEMISWDDLRLVLNLGRKGSLSAAAQELGINVSTCSRRLSHIEAALGTVCFIRRPSGIEMTPVGKQVFSQAEAMELHALSVERTISAAATDQPATVSITCPDSLASIIAIPALRDWIERETMLIVDIATDNHTIDLHRGEAHLALRLRRPMELGLRVRKVAVLGYGLFASREYLEEQGTPRDIADLSKHQLIGIKSTYPDHEPAVWWGDQCSRGRIVCRADRSFDRLECAAAGLGITLLPLRTPRQSELVRVLDDLALPTLEVYLLAEPGALKIPAVRSVADRLAAFAVQHRDELLGLSNPSCESDLEPDYGAFGVHGWLQAIGDRR
jgi:DNA-binding transcriptional LysR family regulator